KSVEVLQRVLQEDSQNLIAKRRLAAVLFSENNFEKAALIIDEILKLAPTDADALLMKGRILLAQDKPGEAAVALQKHAKIRPRLASGRYFLGLSYVQTRDFRKAESEFLNAIKRDSTFFRAHLSLAEIRLNSGDANEAIRYGREALTRGNLDEAHLILSRAFTNVGDFQNAAYEVDSFLRKRPNNALGLYHLGLLKQAQGRSLEAAAHFEAALVADPQNIASLEALSNIYLRQNQPEKAIGRINQVIARFPDNSGAYKVLANAYLAQNNKTKGEEAYEKAISLSTNDVYHRLDIANVYLDTGNFDKSVGILKPLAADDTVRLLAWRGLAEIHLVRKEYQKALDLADSVLKRNNNDADALIIKGRVFLAQGKSAEAIVQLENAVKSQPDYAKAHSHLEQAFQQAKNRQPADSNWAEAVKTQGPFILRKITLAQSKLDSVD